MLINIGTSHCACKGGTHLCMNDQLVFLGVAHHQPASLTIQLLPALHACGKQHLVRSRKVAQHVHGMLTAACMPPGVCISMHQNMLRCQPGMQHPAVCGRTPTAKSHCLHLKSSVTCKPLTKLITIITMHPAGVQGCPAQAEDQDHRPLHRQDGAAQHPVIPHRARQGHDRSRAQGRPGADHRVAAQADGAR
jgi:hypothetical protein